MSSSQAHLRHELLALLVIVTNATNQLGAGNDREIGVSARRSGHLIVAIFRGNPIRSQTDS
jgi:hypothetical protein